MTKKIVVMALFYVFGELTLFENAIIQITAR